MLTLAEENYLKAIISISLHTDKNVSTNEISKETNLSLKEKYWTKIFKSIFDKDNIPSDIFIKTGFNFQNLDLIVSSYLAWNHNKLKKHKKEPKINLIADWKLIYSIYKELKFNSEKDPNFFDSKEIVVTSI